MKKLILLLAVIANFGALRAQTAYKPIHEISFKVEPLPLLNGNIYGEFEWRPVEPVSFTYDFARGMNWNHQPINTMFLMGFDAVIPRRNAVQMHLHMYQYEDNHIGMFVGYSRNESIAVVSHWTSMYARKFRMDALEFGLNLYTPNEDDMITINSQIGFQIPKYSRTYTALYDVPSSWLNMDQFGSIYIDKPQWKVNQTLAALARTEYDGPYLMYEEFVSENTLAGYNPFPFPFVDGFMFVRMTMGVRGYPQNWVKIHKKNQRLKKIYGKNWKQHRNDQNTQQYIFYN